MRNIRSEYVGRRMVKKITKVIFSGAMVFILVLAVPGNYHVAYAAPLEDCDLDGFDDATGVPVPWPGYDETKGDTPDGPAGSKNPTTTPGSTNSSSGNTGTSETSGNTGSGTSGSTGSTGTDKTDSVKSDDTKTGSSKDTSSSKNNDSKSSNTTTGSTDKTSSQTTDKTGSTTKSSTSKSETDKTNSTTAGSTSKSSTSSGNTTSGSSGSGNTSSSTASNTDKTAKDNKTETDNASSTAQTDESKTDAENTGDTDSSATEEVSQSEADVPESEQSEVTDNEAAEALDTSEDIIAAAVNTKGYLDITEASGSILHAGSSVIVSGTGFAGNVQNLEIVIQSEPRQLGFVESSADGSFEAQLDIPEDLSAGAHHIVVLYEGNEITRQEIEIGPKAADSFLQALSVGFTTENQGLVPGLLILLGLIVVGTGVLGYSILFRSNKRKVNS
ncbi:MAG: hypothetical protein K0R05_793 [Anaerocolumna sp.]|nr:hypothetical protein [Anaerocolumna sp.]